MRPPGSPAPHRWRTPCGHPRARPCASGVAERPSTCAAVPVTGSIRPFAVGAPTDSPWEFKPSGPWRSPPDPAPNRCANSPTAQMTAKDRRTGSRHLRGPRFARAPGFCGATRNSEEIQSSGWPGTRPGPCAARKRRRPAETRTFSPERPQTERPSPPARATPRSTRPLPRGHGRQHWLCDAFLRPSRCRSCTRLLCTGSCCEPRPVGAG